MGGANQILTPDKLGIVSDGKAVLVGIDVTHPSLSSVSGAPSIAGEVANTVVVANILAHPEGPQGNGHECIQQSH